MYQNDGSTNTCRKGESLASSVSDDLGRYLPMLKSPVILVGLPTVELPGVKNRNDFLSLN
nr:hypothetical protein [Clostridia bacterium]